jgi:mono/diheme cytochrome c family protein
MFIPASIRSKATLMRAGFASAVLVLVAVGCGDTNGLSTSQTAKMERPLSAAGAPQAVEPDSDETPYPLGLPSARKGRPVYQANCASCHGTYLTAIERVAWDKQKDSPQAEWNDDMKRLRDENRLPGNPVWERKAGPDFYSRDWRFQRTPGELYRLIAYGKDRAGRLHPGPSGKLGEGWKESIKDDRGNQLVATGDPVPIWNAVFYVWSRSVAGHSPQRYKEVWDVYGQNCNVCHGTIGKGDGPLSKTLNPMPFNFHNYKAMAETTDEFLYWRISEGGQFKSIPASIQKTMTPSALRLYVHQWSAMPAWKGVLTEEQRWMAVDGVRTRSYEQD